MHNKSVEEFLDKTLASDKKELDGLLRRLSSKQKKLRDGFTHGDIPGIIEALTCLYEEMPDGAEFFKKIKARFDEYSVEEYINTSFDNEFRAAMNEENIPIRGEFPNYEIFPILVKIIPKEGIVVINKKKIHGIRIKYLVKLIKRERERFFKSPFKSEDFLKDILYGYDLVLATMTEQTARNNRQAIESAAVPIMNVYRALTPMRRWKREYPPQLFGFDIYRLLKEESTNPNATIIRRENGLFKCTFGSVRIGSKKGITIVEESGREVAFGSVKFVKVEGETDGGDSRMVNGDRAWICAQ